VTDHHARSVARNSTKRVIGVLLGQDNGKTINVANSFGIPFEEDEKDSKTWFLDHTYIDGMYDMFRKVNGMFKLLVLVFGFVGGVLILGLDVVF
jgi:26S proteasome regulatory subunit N8